MTQAEYDGYLDSPAHALAQAFSAGTGDDPEEVLERARAHMQELLPAGLQTPGHHFRRVVADGEAVGNLWFHEQIEKEPPQLYLYDIAIDASQRAKGIGTKAMAALEQEAHAVGARQVMLSVFFNNPKAIRLYERLGYVENERGAGGMRMTKALR